VSIREQHIRVQKTARYYLLGEPGAGTEEVWLCCHGYGQLAARFAGHFESLVQPGRLIVVPEALHRFYLEGIDRPAVERRVGATWMTREDRATDMMDYIGYLDALTAHVAGLVAGTVRLVAFGFSQGAATVSRWAVATPHEVSRLILWGAGLPPDLDWVVAREKLQRMQLTLVAGAFDRQMPLSGWTEQERVLSANGVVYERIDFAGGHYLEPATLQRLVV
jgi:predicted esterase